MTHVNEKDSFDPTPGVHISTDTGGTFTDFIAADATGFTAFKRLSTPRDPSISIQEGLAGFQRLASFSHGTTVATNSVLERKGDRTALLTTRGFKDVVFIGRQNRLSLYSFKDHRPPPLISRNDVFEVDERIGSHGEVLAALDKDEIRVIGKHLIEQGYRSVAVVYLFSFLNPTHEAQTGRILEELGLHVSLSSIVVPEYREYERTTTTLMDAFVSRNLSSYLGSLGSIVQSHGLTNGTVKGHDEYFVMESEGGVAPSREVKRIPCKGLLSGPAGGVSGALFVGGQCGLKDLITLDMGGTSTDIARITDLRPEFTSNSTISGLPFARRSLNIVTIGAGGGSIAKRDPGGALIVGPESAGASPGPVCYGSGGTMPTVTDVNLLAGYINGKDFVKSGRDLDKEGARKAVQKLADSLQYDLEGTIKGVLRVVNNNMASALRMVTTEAGKDPRDYTLFAFGGAGPLHSVDLARELDMKNVFVPSAAGMFSAFGILISDVVHSFSVTKVTPLHPNKGNGYLSNGHKSSDGHDDEIRSQEAFLEISAILKKFRKQGEEALQHSGIAPDLQQFFPSVDVRYQGQSYYLNVPFSSDPSSIITNFQNEYREAYGYSLDADLEIVNIRLEARGKRTPPPLIECFALNRIDNKLSLLPMAPIKAKDEPYSYRQCLFGDWMETPVFKRWDLSSDFSNQGHCIIEDHGSTIVIPPQAKFRVDSTGNLEVTI